MVYVNKKSISWYHENLNKDENMPKKPFRRDFRSYELVSYVNNIIGCYLSGNYQAIRILITRIDDYYQRYPNIKNEFYYSLVSEYLELLNLEMSQ